VLSPVPHLGGATDWTTAAQPYRDAIMAHLEATLLPELSKHLVTEHRIDPLHFAGTLNSHLGSAFSIEPTLMQSAWMRPHNVSEDVANLYLCGAGTHPGAGIPGVLSSGKIVADMIGRAAAGNGSSTGSRGGAEHAEHSIGHAAPPRASRLRVRPVKQ
jgi:phytoene desaturase